MDKKINVLVVPPMDRTGCYFYRSLSPHLFLDELYGNDFNIMINDRPDYSNLKSFDNYQIIHIYKGLCVNMEVFYRFLDYCKKKGIKTVIDFDDYWSVNREHPQYNAMTKGKVPQILCENIRKADYITTTTDIFAEKIKKVKGDDRVVVLPNAIDPENQFVKLPKTKSNRLRVGLVMGSSHKKDVEQLKGLTNMLKGAGLLDKIQIVLCGFDLGGTITVMDENGQVKGTRPITPNESVWTEYERILTDEYKIVSPRYKDFLTKYIPNAQYPDVDNEPYRREWTKNINEYMSHYQNVDVLLVPLDCNPYCEVKSELKFVEAGFTHTAVIATDFGPYTIGSVNMLEKGGNINTNGNCILIDPTKAHKAWFKAIKKLVDNPDLVKILQNNMHENVKDKYDIRNVTKIRAEFYKSIAE